MEYLDEEFDDEQEAAPRNTCSFMDKFRDQAELSAEDFFSIWCKFDSDGTGYLEADEIRQFFTELVTTGNDEAISQEALNEMIKTYMDAYDIDGDGKISIRELGEILSVEENFLLIFQHEEELTSVEFMRIWRQYDKDRSGCIDTEELKDFLGALFKRKSETISRDKINDYAETIIKLFDRNNDGKLQLQEMARLLPVQENFLLQFQNKPSLSKEEFAKVFNHYDKDGNGVIQGDELMAFLKDLMEHEQQELELRDIEEYKRVLLRICDVNKDGKLQKAELCMVLCMETGGGGAKTD